MSLGPIAFLALAGCDREVGVAQCEFQCEMVSVCLVEVREEDPGAIEIERWESEEEPGPDDVYFDTKACEERCEASARYRDASSRNCARRAWEALYLDGGAEADTGAGDQSEAPGALDACKKLLGGKCGTESYRGKLVRRCNTQVAALWLPAGTLLYTRRRRRAGRAGSSVPIAILVVGLAATAPARAQAAGSYGEVGGGVGFVEPTDVRAKFWGMLPIVGSFLPQHDAWSPGPYVEANVGLDSGAVGIGDRDGGAFGIDFGFLASEVQERLLDEEDTSVDVGGKEVDYQRLSGAFRARLGPDAFIVTRVVSGRFTWSRPASVLVAGMHPMHAEYFSTHERIESNGSQFQAETLVRAEVEATGGDVDTATLEGGLAYERLVLPSVSTARTDDVSKIGATGHIILPLTEDTVLLPAIEWGIGTGFGSIRDRTFPRVDTPWTSGWYLDSSFGLSLAARPSGDETGVYVRLSHELEQTYLWCKLPTGLQGVRSMLLAGGSF